MPDWDDPTSRIRHNPYRYGQIQGALRDAAGYLRAIDRRLERLGRGLPPPKGDFAVHSELKAVIDCVRLDLLADAADTLMAAGTSTEEELRRAFLDRCRRLDR